MRGRLRLTPGFLALMALLFYLDEGLNLLGWGVLACALHELGHVVAIRALGGRVRSVALSAVGAQLTLDPAYPLSYGRDLLATLAGPTASLVAAWLATRGGLFLLAGMSIGQGVFNLFPMTPLDGGRCVYLLLAPLAGERRAEGVVRAASAVLAGLLVGGGLILLRVFGNVTLLITAAWLTVGLMRKIQC